MEQPKLVYTRFMGSINFWLDEQSNYLNNALNFVSNANYFELALLNSKITWFLLKSNGALMSGGFFQIHGHVLEKLPIPTTTETQRSQLATLAQAAQTAAEQRRDVLKTFGHQVLRDLAPGGATAKLPPTWDAQVPTFADFSAQLKTRYKRELLLAERNDWEAALNAARQTIAALSQTITQSEQAIDRIVYQLFELTPVEIQMIEAP